MRPGRGVFDMKKMLVGICLLLPIALNAQGNVFDPRSLEYRGYVHKKYEPSVEVGRALLPGLLCFVGAAMPDTERGQAWQQGLFFAAGISIGSWKGTRKKDILIRSGCALAGAAAGFIVINNVK